MGFMDWLKGLGGKKKAEPDRVVLNHEEQATPSVASSPAPGAAPADPGSKTDTI